MEYRHTFRPQSEVCPWQQDEGEKGDQEELRATMVSLADTRKQQQQCQGTTTYKVLSRLIVAIAGHLQACSSAQLVQKSAVLDGVGRAKVNQRVNVEVAGFTIHQRAKQTRQSAISPEPFRLHTHLSTHARTCTIEAVIRFLEVHTCLRLKLQRIATARREHTLIRRTELHVAISCIPKSVRTYRKL